MTNLNVLVTPPTEGFGWQGPDAVVLYAQGLQVSPVEGWGFAGPTLPGPVVISAGQPTTVQAAVVPVEGFGWTGTSPALRLVAATGGGGSGSGGSGGGGGGSGGGTGTGYTATFVDGDKTTAFIAPAGDVTYQEGS